MITACHVCGTVLRLTGISDRSYLVCPRCGSVVMSAPAMRRAFSASLAALLLIIPSAVIPFLEIRIGSDRMDITIIKSFMVLQSGGYAPVAAVVAFTALICPLIYVFLIFYVSSDVVFGRRLPFSEAAASAVRFFDGWHMTDVYLIGVLVSVVKLVDMADVSLKPGFWLTAAVGVLIVVASGGYDSRFFWLVRTKHDRH